MNMIGPWEDWSEMYDITSDPRVFRTEIIEDVNSLRRVFRFFAVFRYGNDRHIVAVPVVKYVVTDELPTINGELYSMRTGFDAGVNEDEALLKVTLECNKVEDHYLNYEKRRIGGGEHTHF